MSNLDLINAYFGNEMTEAEMHEFEQRIQRDPELQKEFDFQNEIVSAIREARRAELKAMLDKVPVGGAGGSSFTLGKMATSVAIIALIALGIYYMWPGSTTEDVQPQEEISLVTPEEQEEVEITEPDVNEPIEMEEDGVVSEEITEDKAEAEEIISEEDESKPAEEVPAEPVIVKPDVVPAFETKEDVGDSLEAPGSNLVTKSEDPSSLNVEVDNTKKNYTFHYQFKSGKLFLYGSFDKGLYEILEINAREKKTLFLYYKGKFYPLDANQQRIKSLEPVKDSSLIEKLEKARGEN